MGFAFPGQFEDFLIPDSVFSAAYDAVSQKERAVIKTAIARMATLFGKTRAFSRHSISVERQGFTLYELARPAPWAMVLWDAAYAGPTRILAALMPAMLAGVPNILACRVKANSHGKDDAGQFPAPLLAALELVGQELVAECPPSAALDILKACCEADVHGRLICLGQDAVLDEACRMASSFGLPLFHMATEIRIGLVASFFSDQALDEGLRFAHPDALLTPFEEDAAEERFSALFCAEERVADFLGGAPLILSPGNEGYWTWSGLGIEFFMEISTGLSAVTE